MQSNQWITLLAIICLTFVAVHTVDGKRGHGGHSHENGGHSNENGLGGTQCKQALQFLNQWWPQSALGPAFQTICRQVGVTQAWSILQSLLGVPITGAVDQTTFQALLNNGNLALLAQQLLASVGK